MGIPNTSDNSVMVGSSNSPVQDFLKNPLKVVPPKKDTPSSDDSQGIPPKKNTSSQDSPPASIPPSSTAAFDIPFTEDDRNRIGTKLTEAIAKAALTGDIATDDELKEISNDVLILVNKIETQEDLQLVYDALSAKWPVLSSVFTEDKKQFQAKQHVDAIFQGRGTVKTIT